MPDGCGLIVKSLYKDALIKSLPLVNSDAPTNPTGVVTVRPTSIQQTAEVQIEGLTFCEQGLL